MLKKVVVWPVVTAFAIFVAAPYFGQARDIFFAWIRTPSAWVGFVGLAVGLSSLRQANSMMNSSFSSNGWTLFWLLLGLALVGWAGSTLWMLAVGVV